MKIKKRYIILVSAALAISALFVIKPKEERAVKRDKDLNVLLITIDTLRADRLHCYGCREIKTPNIDRLARSGVRFENAVCPAPLTGPSHASILTSLYPHTHGVRINGYPLRDSILTIAEILKINSYKTAGFVSVNHLGDDVSNLGKGFDTFDWPEKVEQSAQVATKKTINWLNEHGENKFFIWVHYFDPHSDYNPPYPYNVMYDPSYSGSATGSTLYLEKINQGEIRPNERDLKHIDALYKGEVSYVDEWIGVLLDYLKDKGVYENTLIITTADHGEALGEHQHYFGRSLQLYDTSTMVQNYFGHSLQLYDPSIMVPLIFTNRNRLPSNWVVAAQVESIDIAPTILEMVGLVPPDEMEGKSLIGLLEKNGSSTLEKAFVETQNMRWGGLILKENLAQADEIHEKVKSGKEILRCLRTPRWKFILSSEVSGGIDELYDLKEDPGENTNLLYDNMNLADKLREELTEWMKCEKKPERETSGPMAEKTLKTLRSLGYIN